MDGRSNSYYFPEPLIHNILYFLPGKDAIRASATSKPWRSAWISSPALDFDESSAPFKRADFFDYVDRSLALWRERCENKFTMDKFSLCADITDQQSFSRFSELVAFATSHGFKVMDLQSCSDEYWVLFNANSFWHLLLACESLDVLSLRSFGILLPSSLTTTSSVRKLTLSCLCIDENSLRILLSRFPLLEYLVVQMCFAFRELRISCSKLRGMEIVNSDDPAPNLVIEAVNLQSLVYHRTLKSSGRIAFSNCKSLTSLLIDCADFGDDSLIGGYISQIPCLENLTLLGCGLPWSMKLSHSYLKSLKLRHCCGLSEAEINTPNLRLFAYAGKMFLFSRFRYCSGKLNAELALGTFSFDWFWFIKLRNFLEVFSKCNAVKLNSYLEGFPQELRDHGFLPDPLYEMRHLDIMNLKLPIADYASFVVALVELFPGLETLSLKADFATFFIKFDEKGSFALNRHNIVKTSDSDEYTRICQSIDEATNKIMELLRWTEEDTPN